MLDPQALKQDFPIFKRQINGKPLVYLDNAATSQKPKQVIDAISHYYENSNANIHRGVHALSEEGTAAYENSRLETAKFINAHSPEEIIFTRNATESINLVAYTWAEKNIQAGDEILVSALEHHSNFVPWQQLAKRKQASLKIIPLKISEETLNKAKQVTIELDLEACKELLTKKPKLLALTGMSNVLGTITPLKEIIAQAHQNGSTVLIDAAQSVAHDTTDVQTLNADFLAFSGHKMLGPTGIGVLYAKKELLEQMPPFLYGGDMVKVVSDSATEWNDLPHKFEAGTPNIADVIAFARALAYLKQAGLQNIAQHEHNLLKYAIERFSKYPEVTLYLSPEQGGILSFTVKGVHPHDIASIFNQEGIAIRSGHHCNMPLMQKLQIPATARLSFYLYNTEEDIDQAEIALQKTIRIFA
ncbi:cysteine desulfurase [Candidatus Peregrinibacteria bacterium]|nr:cysteine desulfurase [Candidatus Peregrinibacteria bacterium]